MIGVDLSKHGVQVVMAACGECGSVRIFETSKGIDGAPEAQWFPVAGIWEHCHICRKYVYWRAFGPWPLEVLNESSETGNVCRPSKIGGARCECGACRQRRADVARIEIDQPNEPERTWCSYWDDAALVKMLRSWLLTSTAREQILTEIAARLLERAHQ